MIRIFLLIVTVLVSGCPLLDEKPQAQMAVSEEGLELRRQEKKHQLKTIAEFLYDVLNRSTDSHEINRIHRTLVWYFVDHYPKATAALAEAGFSIDILRKSTHEGTSLRDTKNDSAEQKMPKLQDGLNQCEDQSLSAARDYIKSLKGPREREIISEFFDEVIQNFPPVRTASSADILDRLAIVVLMTSCFSNSYPEPLSYSQQENPDSRRKTEIIAKFFSETMLKYADHYYQNIIYGVMYAVFMESYPGARMFLCKAIAYNHSDRKKSARSNELANSNDEEKEQDVLQNGTQSDPTRNADERLANLENETHKEVVREFFEKILHKELTVDERKTICKIMNFSGSSLTGVGGEEVVGVSELGQKLGQRSEHSFFQHMAI